MSSPINGQTNNSSSTSTDQTLKPACSRFKEARHQIKFSRFRHLGELGLAPDTEVETTSELVKTVLLELREKKIVPGFWRTDEVNALLTKFPATIEKLKNRIWKVGYPKPMLSDSDNDLKLTEARQKRKGEPEQKIHRLLLQFSDINTLFSRIFFGNYWLSQPLHSGGKFFTDRTYLKSLSDDAQAIKTITAALNSKKCIASGFLTDDDIFEAACNLGFFSRLMPDSLPFHFFEIFRNALECKELNILNLCEGWAGCIISAAIWARQNPQIEVNLTTFLQENHPENSLNHLEKFLADHFDISNLKLARIVGSFESLDTLKEIQTSVGNSNRILIGTLKPEKGLIYPQNLNTNKRDNLDNREKESCKNFILPTVEKSAHFLNFASNRALAFWFLPRNSSNFIDDPITQTADLCTTFGLTALGEISLLGANNTDKKKRLDEKILVVGNKNHISISRIIKYMENYIISKNEQHPVNQPLELQHHSNSKKTYSPFANRNNQILHKDKGVSANSDKEKCVTDSCDRFGLLEKDAVGKNTENLNQSIDLINFPQSVIRPASNDSDNKDSDMLDDLNHQRYTKDGLDTADILFGKRRPASNNSKKRRLPTIDETDEDESDPNYEPRIQKERSSFSNRAIPLREKKKKLGITDENKSILDPIDKSEKVQDVNFFTKDNIEKRHLQTSFSQLSPSHNRFSSLKSIYNHNMFEIGDKFCEDDFSDEIGDSSKNAIISEDKVNRIQKSHT